MGSSHQALGPRGEKNQGPWVRTRARIVQALCRNSKSAQNGESSKQQRSRQAKIACGGASLRLSALSENLTTCSAVIGKNARTMTSRLSIRLSGRP